MQNGDSSPFYILTQYITYKKCTWIYYTSLCLWSLFLSCLSVSPFSSAVPQTRGRPWQTWEPRPPRTLLRQVHQPTTRHLWSALQPVNQMSQHSIILKCYNLGDNNFKSSKYYILFLIIFTNWKVIDRDLNVILWSLCNSWFKMYGKGKSRQYKNKLNDRAKQYVPDQWKLQDMSVKHNAPDSNKVQNNILKSQIRSLASVERASDHELSK